MIKSNIPTYPLISGDFYASSFDLLNNKLKEAVKLKSLAEKMKWNLDIDEIEEEFTRKDNVILITNPNLQIVHATENIFDMNGYLPSEIIGKSPKIFQGEKTSKAIRKRIAEAIQKQIPFEEIVVNYKKDKSIYKCWIKGVPVKNQKGKVVNFIAFEKEVA